MGKVPAYAQTVEARDSGQTAGDFWASRSVLRIGGGDARQESPGGEHGPSVTNAAKTTGGLSNGDREAFRPAPGPRFVRESAGSRVQAGAAVVERDWQRSRAIPRCARFAMCGRDSPG